LNRSTLFGFGKGLPINYINIRFMHYHYHQFTAVIITTVVTTNITVEVLRNYRALCIC
jgi:hypothetical protein